MKYIFVFLCFVMGKISTAQTYYEGSVKSAITNEPIAKASVRIKDGDAIALTDAKGYYRVLGKANDTLIVSYIGYSTRNVVLGGDEHNTIYLKPAVSSLGEVIINTGFQSVPKARATGSFTSISNELLNRTPGMDILSRLEGISNSLLFDRKHVPDPSGASRFNVRGFSSISSDNQAPLIIVDNFPYDGDINNINPNDILNVTILKDAAASSIWGARAGNGVIVFTTKKGSFDQPVTTSFNVNTTIGSIPDLYYSPSFLNAESFIGYEQLLFENGFYDATLVNASRPLVSPAVELLVQERDGRIDRTVMEREFDVLRRFDIRDQARQYLYRNSLHQQYTVNLSGGSKNLSYYLSGGYDQHKSEVKENDLNRFSLSTTSNFKPFKFLEIGAGMFFIGNQRADNGYGIDDIKPQSKNLLPYTQIADSHGRALPVPYQYRSLYENEAAGDRLLDWKFYPLNDRNLRDNMTQGNEFRGQMNVKINLPYDIQLNVQYQYQNIQNENRILWDKDSYYLRGLVNRFTQSDGTRVFPYGGFLNQFFNKQIAHSGRAQLDYDRVFDNKHEINFLGGLDIREISLNSSNLQLYGFDPQTYTYQTQLDYLTYYPTRPRSNARLPNPVPDLGKTVDRYLSYFSNFSYSYENRYILSGSVRWDASNLFGVRSNQKGIPLWSSGIAWLVNREKFYDWDWMPELKLRFTYGYNGNVDKTTTVFPTAYYDVSWVTGLKTATITSPGNSHLRWERVRNVNLGLDFGSRNNRIRGSLEFYQKNSSDLIGPILLDPTLGFPNRHNINYAALKTEGVDVELNSINIQGKMEWRSTLLVNYSTNRIEEYEYQGTVNSFLQGGITEVGDPLNTLYSYPWYGLDSNTGDPLVNVDGESGTDYSRFVREIKTTDLIRHGSRNPPLWGSLRNTFSFRGVRLSALITWKTGYYFRRNSINYYQLANNWVGHQDFEKRWQQPGDEIFTNVPSAATQQNQNRDRVYGSSAVTVDQGDHIRLQDVTLEYRFPLSFCKRIGFRQFDVFCSVRNLGILWRKSDNQIDPDMPLSIYPQMRLFSFGIKSTL